MAVLRDFNALSAISALTGRGLTLEQIERAMEKMVGLDWKEVPVRDWHRRLRDEKFIVHDDHAKFLDDLEALVNGRILLDELYARDRRWGRA